MLILQLAILFLVKARAFEIASDDLLIYPSPLERSIEKCCEGEHYLSCQRVDLNFQDFDQMKRSITVHGINFNFVRQVPPTGFVYKNMQGDEAVFSYNKVKRHLFGNINKNDGSEYEIESCHNGHVLKEIDVKNLGSEKPEMTSLVKPQSPADATADTKTIVTFSLMFYYTPEFEAVTADIEGFVDQIVDITNEGFINSEIPVRVKAFCIEKASLTDSTGTLSAFRAMKGSSVATLNTADAATLLVTNAPYCGVAWLTPAYRDYSFSVNMKRCVGNFVVGHELGHNFGSHHDIYSATNQNNFYSYGYGHHIERGSHSTGARTILAYYRSGFNARVNYYSNPSVILPLTGTPTGVAGVSNTASVITQNRFTMASHGDESAACGKTEEECDSGWMYFEHTGKCYKSFERQQTREDAIKGCMSANPSASLVSITDMKTNDFVLSKVSWRSWIGLEKQNGAWIWPDGSRDSLRNWIPGQPSGDGSFVEIVKDAWTGKSGQWNDLGSTWRGQTILRGSVCQYDLKGCNPGWTFFPHTGKCYRSIESRLSRAKAINACKASNPNANLAIISDVKTNDFLISMVKWRSWIGLEKRNGAWVWPDGTRDSLRNWIPGQPSGDGSFVEIVKDAWAGKPGQWNDLGLKWNGQTILRGTICQYDQ